MSWPTPFLRPRFVQLALFVQLVLQLVLLLAATTGCGHQTRLFTDVTDAKLSVGDDSNDAAEPLHDPWGGPQHVAVEVESPTGRVSFEVERKEVALFPVLCGAGGGALLGGGACGAAAASIALASLSPDAAGLAGLALPALLVGATAMFACPATTYWLWGRQGPDEINVSFDQRRILVTPEADVRRVRWRPAASAEPAPMAH